MYGYVPEGFFERYMSEDSWFVVPMSVILAVPMYANAAGIVPVVQVFRRHGFGFHDGGSGTLAAGSHTTEKSDVVAADSNIFLSDMLVHHNIGLSFQ